MLRIATHYEASVSMHLAACIPSGKCTQAINCARCDAACCDPRQCVIDATVLRHTGGAWCPLFIDVRGAALEAA